MFLNIRKNFKYFLALSMISFVLLVHHLQTSTKNNTKIKDSTIFEFHKPKSIYNINDKINAFRSIFKLLQNNKAFLADVRLLNLMYQQSINLNITASYFKWLKAQKSPSFNKGQLFILKFGINEFYESLLQNLIKHSVCYLKLIVKF
jgi:hypothetical protein